MRSKLILQRGDAVLRPLDKGGDRMLAVDTWARAPLAIAIGLTLALVGVMFGARPAHAFQTTPPPYSHSWYITNADPNTLYNRGYADGAYDNQWCYTDLAVLDFGQIENESNPGYAGYGTYEFNAPIYSTVPMSQIESATEQYAQGWYNATIPCPRLIVAIGVNNYNECPFGNTYGTCSPSGFGAQLANLVDVVKVWLDAHGISWQVSVDVASDMETGYDSASKTRPFVDGFNGNDPNGYLLFDYGDAWVNGSWSTSDIYYVSWGAAHDVPLPEIYTQAGANAWTNVRLSATMYFMGVMAECHSGDPLPSGTCSNPSGQNTPTQAWNQLWNTLNANGVGQDGLAYATDINYQ